ncbi:MAG: hypothetical protein MUF38_12400 [Anaerolineae bacterium]|jgi:hypothetical protein|nr:hypothetical protein [Anaerolineae bacterium]
MDTENTPINNPEPQKAKRREVIWSSADWTNNLRSQWTSRGERRAGNTVTLTLSNGRTYSASLGQLIFGAILLVVLPFKMVLLGGIFAAALYFGRRSSGGSPKIKRDGPVAV